MPRRNAAPVREILPDPLFESEKLAKFINAIMRSGKKSIAEKIVYGALNLMVQKQSKVKGKKESDVAEHASASTDFNIRASAEARKLALDLFERALENVMPSVEVKSRRVGGSNYQVPVEIRAKRRMALAMRWLAEYANERNEKTMEIRLAHEMLDAVEGRGGAVKKREDVHRMAKANQAFAHYRW